MRDGGARHVAHADGFALPAMKPSCFSPESSSSVCCFVSLMQSVEKMPVSMKNAKISSLRKPRCRQLQDNVEKTTRIHTGA